MKQGRENSRVATHFAVQSTATQNSAKGLTLPTFIGDSGSGTSAFCFYCLSPQGQLSEKGIIGFSFPLNSLYTKNLRQFGFYYNKEAEPLQAFLLRFYEKKPPFYQRKHRIFFRQNFASIRVDTALFLKKANKSRHGHSEITLEEIYRLIANNFRLSETLSEKLVNLELETEYRNAVPIYENIEKYSMIRSLKAIERSDVCCVVINAEEGIIEHDKHIVSYAINAGKAVVLVVNKWDTIKDFDTALKDWKQKIKNEFQFIPYVKTVFLSAKTKKRVSMLLPAIIEAYNNSVKEVPTNVLNDVITEAYNLHEAPSYKGKRLKIYFTHQTGSKPPKITFEVNNKVLVHFSYERYLENKIREAFDFTGTPIILLFKNRSEK